MPKYTSYQCDFCNKNNLDSDEIIAIEIKECGPDGHDFYMMDDDPDYICCTKCAYGLSYLFKNHGIEI